MEKIKKFRLTISTKLLIFFLIVSLIPLFLVNIVLVSSAKSLLLNAAETRQQIVADDTASNVDNYLANKTSALSFQAGVFAVRNLNTSGTSPNLAVLVKEDPTVQKVAYLNASGIEENAFTQQGQVQNLTNQASSDAFKAIGFLGGKNYISSVSYDSEGNPQITIAVPVLKTNLSQNYNNLQSANFGKYTDPSDIQGVIVANYDISGLWQSVLSTKIGNGGYAYVVDGLGNLVAHPNNKYLISHQKISTVQAVNEFITGQTGTRQTVSEIGKNVISTPRKLTRTNWAVIVEEPVSSIFAGINSFLKLSEIIFIGAVIFSILMSLIFRKQLINPINKLMFGVKSIEHGDYDQTIVVKSNDELQELANTFNSMGLNIKNLVGDLKNKNQNLVVEQTKLNSIISSVSDGIVALNDMGEIISINPPAARLINNIPIDLKGKTITDYYPFLHEGKQLIIELIKPGQYQYNDLTLYRGNEISYLDVMVTVIDRKDSDIAAILTIHDQTQSRELDVMKLDFVAIAAHELRTPVTVVQGYLSLLKYEALNQLTIHNIENLQKAIVGTDQLRDLINKLLNISRIERGEMDIHIEKLDLAQLVKEVSSHHEPTALIRGQHIIYTCNVEDYVYVPGDISSLTEVLNNLIGNAMKYTPEGGNIRVKVIASKTQARVEVSDEGPGIATDARNKLFTKFYRVERSLVAGNRGTGLGLYISKTIIDLHHGKIGLEPYTGKGSVFYFDLPIYVPELHDKLVSKEKESGGIHGWFKKRTPS